MCYCDSGFGGLYMFELCNTSKLSTVELTLGDMEVSVEATISVKVVDGKWPEGFRAAAEGTIQLSRRVVSVEDDGGLRVSIMASCSEDQTVERVSKAKIFQLLGNSQLYGGL